MVGADDEPVPGGLPAAVVADRVGLAVDDVDRRAAQPPPRRRGHHVVELVDVPRREGGPAESGRKHALGGAEAELHRPQRPAVGGINGQGGAQLVAQVGVVGADVAVALGGVPLKLNMHQSCTTRTNRPGRPASSERTASWAGSIRAWKGMSAWLRKRVMARAAANGCAEPGKADSPVTAALTACACSLTSFQNRSW